jgi:hypothetical protein
MYNLAIYAELCLAENGDSSPATPATILRGKTQFQRHSKWPLKQFETN